MKKALAVAALAAVAVTGCGPLLYPVPAPAKDTAHPGMRALELPTRGEPARALYVPPADGRAVVAFFHGNGTDIEQCRWLATELATDGIGTLLVEYPGYGHAAGAPSEEAIYRAAARALDEIPRLEAKRPRLVLVGQSLGSAVAVEMAIRGYGDALVLISPFSSIPDIVDGMVPFGLGGLFVTDHFDSWSKARAVPIRTVVAQGDADWVVPIAMARDVAERIPRATFETFVGAGHNDMFDRDGGRLLAIIRDLSR